MAAHLIGELPPTRTRRGRHVARRLGLAWGDLVGETPAHHLYQLGSADFLSDDELGEYEAVESVLFGRVSRRSVSP